MTKKIVIADDQPALRVGLRRVLEETGEFQVVGEVASAGELLTVAREKKPDLVVMDLRIGGGCAFETITQLREEIPQGAILVFSTGDDAKHVRRALKAGATGYLLKSGAIDEVLKAIRLVVGGTPYISPEVSDHVVNAILHEDEVDVALSGLTRREREVLRLVAEGSSSRQIAAELGISTKTVETHRARMMSKLGIHKSSKLVRFAIDAGVLDA